MICASCRLNDHARCVDIYWGPVLETGEHLPEFISYPGVPVVTEPVVFFLKPGRLYPSCNCLHRPVGPS